ncbi:acyl-homoserine-lactone synthase [Caenispirillum salinarum]|uniref:acyl-homoserine-lactone synthase n=1 Tax=Caenispirillum salinarum TaxID=859058 RepID=UPI00384F5EE5
MLDCLTWGTAHHFGDALAGQHRLRYRVFVQRAGWNVPHINEMEWDQYDTPAAHYLVWRDDNGEARGVVRFSPTNVPYMIADIWPEMVTDVPLPRDTLTWEATRLAVDPSASPALRRQIRREMVVGIMEFGLMYGVQRYIHLMPPTFVRSFLLGNGMNTWAVGPTRRIDGVPCAVWLTEVSAERLETVRKVTGVRQPVLRLADDDGMAPAVAA